MTSQVYKYLINNSTKPLDVDRLIVSSFLKKNNLIQIQNSFIQNYIISENNEEEYNRLNNFIEILEKECSKARTICS